MPKQLKVFAVCLLCIIGGAFVFLLTSKTPMPINEPTSPPSSTSQSQPESTTPSSDNDGQYTAYQDNSITDTPGTKLLFFHASWCPQCRDLDASIQASSIPADVTIFKVDYDSRQDLRKTYGVTIQTTVVKVDDQGNLVKKYVAYNEPTLQSLIDNLL